jgi:hypothetical protein
VGFGVWSFEPVVIMAMNVTLFMPMDSVKVKKVSL